MLKAVGEIFVRHRAQDIFGIHLLHSHFTAPKGTVLLGIEFPITDTTQACWTKPVPAEELAGKPVHGHVFRMQPDGTFAAYEFHQGEAAFKRESIELDFFKEFADFLRQNNLADLLALELLDGPQDHIYKELQVGPQATVLLNEKDVIGLGLSTITTGWSFKVGDNGIISCKGGTVYSPKKNTHGVFVDSKPLTVESLKKALRGEGIIA
ncbi:hypothetical protein N7468_001640 [Penicillium chermesinum]|uniref:Uncharacterized protein n=1 Tax=Penicillium chermesinum TaxID=63820 RepID=A0A9W9PJY0_9EURO|nr:uncharacterized protein N7468_001640 [Penicillium chermesinum]KAJ5246657.1 hypothetical protein N7468_001640 [Penicillium chermesinum]KAJ6144929.1 hypothetical protein N7470_008824 [Penicillium chermesinum]